MKKYIRPLLLIFLLIKLPIEGKTQVIRNVTVSKFTQADGLSSYFITKIIKDSYGFIWVGTQDGLDRFDGKTFSVVRKSASGNFSLSGSYISDIVEDKNHFVWVATSYEGIYAIDTRTNFIKKHINKDKNGNQLSLQWIRCLSLHNNILFIGTASGLYAFDIDKNVFVDCYAAGEIQVDIKNLNVEKIAINKNNDIQCLCDDNGVVILDSNRYVKSVISSQDLNINHTQSPLKFIDVAEGKNGETYIATNWGLRILSPENAVIYFKTNKEIPDIFSTEILSVFIKDGNTLFLSTKSNLFSYNLLTAKSTLYKETVNKEMSWLHSVFRIYGDAQSNIWIGNQEGLAYFTLQEKPFVNYYSSYSTNETIHHLYSILPINDSELYCGDENGLFYVNTLTGLINKIDTAQRNLLLFKAFDNDVFVSNKNGFSLIKGNTTKPANSKYSYLNILQNDQLSSAIQYNDTIICFSSIIQKGLSIWNTKSSRLTIFHNDSLLHKIDGLSVIDYLYKSRDHKLWLITEKSIYLFNPLTSFFKQFYISDPQLGNYFSNFMDMCETDSSYFIATYGSGIIETDKKVNWRRKITSLQGLCNDNVYRLFNYKDSLIIATTNNGLAVINLKTKSIKNYYQSDGLHSNAFEQLCGYQKNNLIYAGGVNGFTIIDPSKFAVNTERPFFYFTSIQTKTADTTFDTTNLEIKQLNITENWLQTNVSFIGINYSNPARVTYQYRIKERDSTWVSLGTQNFVNLIGLNSGTYTLEVKAANEDGYWSQPKKLRLTFLPKWYQTLLFKIFLFTAIAAIPFTFYRYRLSQLKKQQQIRQSISSDLHDDIGATLNSVRLFTHLAVKTPAKEEYLNQVIGLINLASVGLRDMIWVLDDSRDGTGNFISRIKQFAMPIAEASNIRISFDVQDDIKEELFNKSEKRNLFLIAKEAINNSIKYAACSAIQVTLTQVHKKTSLVIKDNGNGFDENTVKKGNGLHNIHERAKQINYIADIVSQPGKGTSISISKK